MPFRLTNAPVASMNDVFWNMFNHFVLVYLGDIYIYHFQAVLKACLLENSYRESFKVRVPHPLRLLLAAT